MRSAPVIVVETERGTFEFETYPKDAPKTVEHIVTLVKSELLQRPAHPSRRGPGFVIQLGDPQTQGHAEPGDRVG